MREPGILDAPRQIGRPRRGPGDPAESQIPVTLPDLLDHRLALALGEARVAAEVRERMRDLGDATPEARNTKVLHETVDRRIKKERRFDRLDKAALGDGRVHATSERSARRTSSRARVTL